MAVALAHPEMTGKQVSTFLGQRVNAEGAKSTLNAYRSALSWRFGTEGVKSARVTEGLELLASIRRDVGDVSQLTPADFAAAVERVAPKLGDVWADYKAAAKADRDEEKAAAEALAAQRLPDLGDDPLLTAQTAAIMAIKTLREAGANDALAAIAAELAVETVRQAA
ncbi:MAG: hypothetical protein ACREEW_14385 [Caulobacteraceae bacterium]